MEIVLVVMVVFAFVVVAWLTLAQSGEPPRPGKAAPDFRLQGIDGKEQSLSALRGTRAVIVFHPQDETPECVAVVERLAAAAPAMASAGAWLATVVVSRREAAQAYAGTHAAGLRVLCDADGRAAKAYGALVNLGFMKFARKLIVLVDARGNVERVWRDAVGSEQVDELLGVFAGPPR
ncbi:MAG TPA: redoxin domain-containing protein [Usitatibacteraceae bacterium]|nr:redoxin domain-containing protein [Usitatibacteraceae bacterium]